MAQIWQGRVMMRSGREGMVKRSMTRQAHWVPTAPVQTSALLKSSKPLLDQHNKFRKINGGNTVHVAYGRWNLDFAGWHKAEGIRHTRTPGKEWQLLFCALCGNRRVAGQLQRGTEETCRTSNAMPMFAASSCCKPHDRQVAHSSCKLTSAYEHACGLHCGSSGVFKNPTS